MSERWLPNGIIAAGAGVCPTTSHLPDYVRTNQARINPRYVAQFSNVPTLTNEGVTVERPIRRRTPDEKNVFPSFVEGYQAAAD